MIHAMSAIAASILLGLAVVFWGRAAELQGWRRRLRHHQKVT